MHSTSVLSRRRGKGFLRPRLWALLNGSVESGRRRPALSWKTAEIFSMMERNEDGCKTIGQRM